MKTFALLIAFFLCLADGPVRAQQNNHFSVIAYWAGQKPEQLDSFAMDQLTHIIYSFCHLRGNELVIDNAQDTAMVRALVAQKKRNPALKVMLSLGGWGGCETCSPVFSKKDGRKAFARSVRRLCEDFGTDGIDLDWEYPAIEGYPGHPYKPEDRDNFTELVHELRKELGKSREISFAAGGFNQFIDRAVDWKKVMKKADWVNLMTYDLVNGYSRKTGHHTPLYSTSAQQESVDNAVGKLIALGIDPRKIVIGAAMYGRMWEQVPDTNSGLYQPGHFRTSVGYNRFAADLSPEKGFVYHWDEQARAPYLFNPSQHLFVTYDDPRSMALKTQYVREKGLGGIMFWQLASDVYRGGLLEAIDRERR